MPTTRRFETWLLGAIETCTDIEREDGCPTIGIREIETFKEAGVLTTNPGLVVTFGDGSELQLTIVRSKLARDGSHPDEEPGDDEGSERTAEGSATEAGLTVTGSAAILAENERSWDRAWPTPEELAIPDEDDEDDE